MTVHEEAINWLCQQFPNAINNHYRKFDESIRIEGLIPDILVDDGIHEVECISDKVTYQRIKEYKVLWVVIPNFTVFNQINLLGETDNQFEPLKTFTPKIISEQAELNRLKHEIKKLKTHRNRLTRKITELEKTHNAKQGKAHRVLYLLPSFQFERELTVEKCAICGNQSDLIISSESVTPYGLCQHHFNALIKIEEKA